MCVSVCASVYPANRCTDVIIIVVMWRWRWIAHLTCNTVSSIHSLRRRSPSRLCIFNLLQSGLVCIFIKGSFFSVLCRFRYSFVPSFYLLSAFSGSSIQWVAKKGYPREVATQKMGRKEKNETCRDSEEFWREHMAPSCIISWTLKTGCSMHSTHTESLQLYLQQNSGMIRFVSPDELLLLVLVERTWHLLHCNAVSCSALFSQPAEKTVSFCFDFRCDVTH